MEPIEKIRNDKLVAAYEAMHKNTTKETQAAVTCEMIKATFLMPAVPVAGKLPEDFIPKVLKDNEGKTFLPVFTDMDHARAGIEGLADCLVPVDISDAYSYLVEKAELDGVIVNAFAKPNLICVRPMVQSLAKLWSRYKTAELNGEDPETVLHPQKQNVSLLVPKEYPSGVTDALEAGLKDQEDIEKAWMCLMRKNPSDPPEVYDWLIILSCTGSLKGRESLFQALGETLKPFVDKHNLIFVENAPNFKDLTDRATPVYTKA